MTGARYLPKGRVERILVPTDFSSGARLALDRAVTVARLYGASIWLLHVITPFTLAGLAGMTPSALGEMFSAGEAAIEELVCYVRRQNVPCTGLVRDGALDDQVREFILEFGIDLLVMATTAGQGVGGLALGSTAERILRKTFIPVITVGTCRALRSWPEPGPAHILYATDMSDESFRSLAYARSVQRRFSARLTLVHVLPLQAEPERVQTVLEQLRGLAADDEEVHVLHGEVGPALCKAIAKMGIDLVALGVEKRTALGEYLFGHTLVEILAGSPCPVLTIRQWK
jgi:nucleotide-binding universal stress UspA family protein